MLGSVNPPPRYLLGPGPAPVEPSILAALGKPPLGPSDPERLALLGEACEGLRTVFRSSFSLTGAVAGSRLTGMEAVLANVLEPGDRVTVAVGGFTGRQLSEAARRLGAKVTEVKAPDPGAPVPLDDLGRAAGGAKAVLVAHVESATGVRHPLESLREAVGTDPLLVVDASWSLGGIPLQVGAWGIDGCFSAGEHCIGAPPGLALLTLSPRAEEASRARSAPVVSASLEAGSLRRVWDGSGEGEGGTLAPPLLYGLHEALRLVLREGLEARWKRHADAGRFLQGSLEELGFEIVAFGESRVPQLTVGRLPEGVDDGLRAVLLHEYDIEVGAGLDELAGKAWRIGLMGFGARREHALRLLQALRALFALPGGPSRAVRH